MGSGVFRVNWGPMSIIGTPAACAAAIPARTVARHRLFAAHNRVVGADLPDDQPRPAGLQRALQPSQSADRQLAANPSVLDVEVDACPLFKLCLKSGWIGIRRR